MPLRWILILQFALGLSGCALWKGEKKEKSHDAAESEAQVLTENFLGTISMVNEEGRFVLVDFGGFMAPTAGLELQVRRAGETVATLKAGTEMRRPFAAADIVQGTPQPGDDVWSKKPTP